VPPVVIVTGPQDAGVVLGGVVVGVAVLGGAVVGGAVVGGAVVEGVVGFRHLAPLPSRWTEDVAKARAVSVRRDVVVQATAPG